MRESSRFAEARLVLGYLRESLAAHVGTAAALTVLAVVLGAAPTLQSAIESNLLNTLADASSPNSETGATDDRSFGELVTEWDVAIPGLDMFSPTGSAFGSYVVPLGTALVIYAAIVAAIVVLEVLSAWLSARIVRGYFVTLQRRGWEGALHSTPGLERRLSEARRTALDQSAGPAVERQDDQVEELSGYWSRAIQEGAEAVSYTAVNTFDLARNLVTFVTATFVIWQLGSSVLVAFFVVVIVTCLLTMLQTRQLRVSRQRLESEGAVLSGRMNDALAHRDLIRAWEQTRRVRGQIEADARRLVDVEQKLAVATTGYREATRVVFDVGRLAAAVCFVVFVGVENGSTFDVFLVSTLYFRLLGPVRQLAFWIDHWARTRATTQIFTTVVEERAELTSDDVDATPIDPGPPVEIEFEEVDFSYPRPDGGDRRVFDRISFKIPSGKATLLVGRSGCGKTTLSRMMMGFIAPTRGFVRVGGIDVADWPPHALLKQFSYVAQGHNVLHGSVKDNLFNSSTPDHSLEDALKKVGLSHVSLNDPATSLSTGQQQRLALARVLVSDAPILVLDEPTTGLDAFTMRELMPVLKDLLFSGRTVVMITHRLVFAEKFDYAVMILDNAAVEVGAPVDLLARDGSVFKSLYAFAKTELEGVPK